MSYLRACLLIAALTTAAAAPARADLFVLANEGQVQGELVNKDEAPRTKYVIQTEQGGTITLSKEQVVEVRRQTPAQQEYDRIRPQFADTVAGQWELAEWCRTNNLFPARETHLKRILELDPEHEPARRGLGYSRVDGRWVTQEQLMTERGYVRYKGRWRLPQEVELLEGRRQAEVAEKEWYANLKRWRDWLQDERAEKALELIRQIDNPAAVAAIRSQLESERLPKVRSLWLECLGRIASPAALETLVNVSLEDADLEVRMAAIDELVPHKHPNLADMYIKSLKGRDNATINRAAVGLASVGDETAVGPLIDALVTSHKFKITQGSNQINSTFGSGGLAPGSFSVGSKTTYVTQQFANEAVRDALVRLTGVNFNFDIDKWKVWHAAQQRGQGGNVRRD